MDSRSTEANGASFEREVLARSHTVPVVVDFWASWCGPCRTLGPILEDAVSRLAGKVALVKVDADQNPDLCAAYGVQSIPAVLAFRDGRVVAEFVGAQPRDIVEAWLRGLIPSDQDEVLEQARRDIAGGRRAEAETALKQFLATHPDDAAVLLELSRLAAARGDLDAARTLLSRIPDAALESEQAVRDKLLLDLLAAGGQVRSLDAARARALAAPDDLEARFALAGALWLSGRPEMALDELLEIVRRDRGFRQDGARRALLALFERLGHDHPAVGPALTKLGNILFT